jgi:hypothetical protein
MVDSQRIRAASVRLLEPYAIPADTVYLSDDQRELSELPFEKRAEWMAEWLLLASCTDDSEGDEDDGAVSPAVEASSG